MFSDRSFQVLSLLQQKERRPMNEVIQSLVQDGRPPWRIAPPHPLELRLQELCRSSQFLNFSPRRHIMACY